MIQWFSFLLLASAAFGLNLAEYNADFVLETKKIDIPGHPYAFNPSLVRYKGSILMTFRVLPENKKSFKSNLYLIRLDESFEPIGSPQLLSFRPANSSIPPRAEDGRLIEIANRLFLIYSDCGEAKISKKGFRTHIAELGEQDDRFYIVQSRALTEFEGASDSRREKNWTPFDYRDTLLLSYSFEPHLVFYPDLWTSQCHTIARTFANLAWPWGELRGGTTALSIENGYLTFFHTVIDIASEQSQNREMPHYFMGACTFSADPPFSLQKISPSPISCPDFYSPSEHQPYWRDGLAIFPCGFIQDDAHIWISYGKQDHETWIAKLDKKKLLESLVPVQSP